jgi:hypothetical protein
MFKTSDKLPKVKKEIGVKIAQYVKKLQRYFSLTKKTLGYAGNV